MSPVIEGIFTFIGACTITGGILGGLIWALYRLGHKNRK